MKMNKIELQTVLKKVMDEEGCTDLFLEYFGPGAIITNKLAIFKDREEIDFGDFSQQYVLKSPGTYLKKSIVSTDTMRAFFSDLNEYLERKASAKSQIMQNECIDIILRKKRRGIFLLMALMIVGAVAAIVFTIMGHCIKGDKLLWLKDVPEVIGVVDLAFGAIAFVVERLADMEGKKVVAAGELYRKDPNAQTAQNLTIINVKIHNGDDVRACFVCKK